MPAHSSHLDLVSRWGRCGRVDGMNTSLESIVVTGANGLVGARVCAALSERDVPVRAVVRRAGTAPTLPGVEEIVGEFHDRELASRVARGAAAVVHTVHPMADEDLQEASVDWARSLAETARDAGVKLFVHVSTTSVYERGATTGDVDEYSALVDDTAHSYSVTKRDTEAAIAEVDGMTRVFVRPTAILGPGETSVWNSLRPQAMRADVDDRTEDPDRTFGWVHLDDLADLIADVATGSIRPSDDPEQGPVPGEVTAVNAVSGSVTTRDYVEPVCRALDVEPVWQPRKAFRAQLLANRARAWGWDPKVTFDEAMAELVEGLTA